MINLLREWLTIHDDNCWYDHHGYCQAHFLEEDCLVKRTRKFIEDYDANSPKE